MRIELEAQQVTPFKHALVMGDDTYPVTKVNKRKDRVRISSETMVFIFAVTYPVTVDVISGGDDNDPGSVRAQAAQIVDRRAAKPSWRVGRRFYRGGGSTVRPR